MAYIVTDKCIGCKYTECAAVCPVSCFHAGKNMLVIDPDVCIDCGVCVPECPIEAIVHDTDSEASEFLELNKTYSQRWPVIDQHKPPLPNAEKMVTQTNKMSLFSPEPDPDLVDTEKD